jgi:hypothetical protein
MVLPVPTMVVAEVIATLTKDERRCDFGVCLPCHVIYSYFDDFVNFVCHARALQLFEPAQASSPHLIITKPQDDVMDISSSDTEARLDLLFLSPVRKLRCLFVLGLARGQ